MKLNYGKTFLLGFGFFGVSVIWGVYNAFVPLFLANKFDLAPVWIGFFMTLDNIAALLIQPPVGAWSDRLRTPIGRRMPFILIGAPVAALAFGLIPMASILPLFVACTSTLLLSMAFWRTPVIALMPDVTPSQFRSQANGVINFMGGVGAIISFLIGARLYEMNPAFPFWLGSILVIIASLLVFAFIREPKVYQASEEKPSLWLSLKGVLGDSDKSALRILLAIFFWFLGYNAIEAFFTLYAQKHLGLPGADGARLLGQLSLIFVIFALPAGYIGARFGRRKTILTGIALMALIILVIYLLPVDTLTIRLTKLPVLGVVPVIGVVPDDRRRRLGADQHQLAADGGRHDRCRPSGHLYRAVLPVFHPGCHRWTERQRLAHPAHRAQLQRHHVARPLLHGGRLLHDAGCPPR